MKNTFIIAATMASAFGMAQATSPAFSVALNDPAKKISLNPVSGVAIVNGVKGTYGISHHSQQTAWSIENKNLYSGILQELITFDADLSAFGVSKEEIMIEHISGSPYSIITKGLSKNIINSTNGQILFSTEKEKWYPTAHHYLPNTTTLLVEFLKNQKSYIGNIDLETGQIRWIAETKDNQESFAKQLKNLITLKGFASISPKVDNQGNVYGFFTGRFIKMNGKTGEVIWQKEMPKLMNFDVNKNDAYIITQSRAGGLGGLLGIKESLNILDSQTGNPIWKEDNTVGKVVYLEDFGDKFLLASYSGTNLYDYQSGKKLWKKDIKDDPRMMIKSNGGYIFVSKNEMNFITEEGKELWKKEVEISDNKDDEIIELKERNGKIFYITTTYANIVDINTGKKIWNKNLKLEEKRPTFFGYNEENKEYVIYNDERLYQYTISTTERPEAFSKPKIKREKEVSHFEIRPNGYLISGLGEMVFVNKKGDIVYQNYYDEPGGTGRVLGRIGLNVLGTAAALGTATLQDQSGNTIGGLFFDEKGRDIAGSVSSTAFELDNRMKNRFDATSQEKDYSFFFTKDGKDKVLVRVNKDTGKEENKFLFQNNKPLYSVDEHDRIIYYINDKNIDVFKY